MKLLVFYLTDNRRHFTFPHFINILNKSQNKDNWKLLILTHTDDNDYYKEVLNDYKSIHYEILTTPQDNNYLRKINLACSYATEHKFPYVMKCDNDIFIKYQTLDYMVDNLHLLENSRHLTLGPVLTSGIPGIEYFKEQFLDEESQKHIDKLFLNTIFHDNFGAPYTFLNKHTIQSSVWKKEDFFESMRTMAHHYKGIHPIRVNEEAIHFLNNYIIAHKEKFMGDFELSVINKDNSPYLCNSIFCIKTETYKSIVSDHSLYVDMFEEVPLNKYCWKNNMNHLFVKNGYSIHMYYNWHNNHINREKEFCKSFFQ